MLNLRFKRLKSSGGIITRLERDKGLERKEKGKKQNKEIFSMRTKNKMCTMEEITFVEKHINEMTDKELARALGVTLNHIHGILQYYRIKRSAEGLERAHRDRVNTTHRLNNEERERVKQGLPQLTKIKLNKKFLAKYRKV